MHELSAWLLKRVKREAEEAAAALARVGGNRWDRDLLRDQWSLQGAAHVSTWRPERVLAECAAKKRIIGLTESTVRTHQLCTRCVACVSLRELALPYAAWPGYREEWRP